MKRYIKNMDALSMDEIQKLIQSRVCVIGCGGLGGYIVEMLGRIGVGFITIIDGDVFNETNLNRQLVSHVDNIGLSKVGEAKKRMELVNPLIHIKAINTMIDGTNASLLLNDHDVIVDALDNIKTRIIVQSKSSELNIPLVHGAIGGFYGQVTTIFPGDNTLDFLYPKNSRVEKGIEERLGNPSFIPTIIASVQVAEVIKILIDRGNLLRKKVLLIDLLENSFDIIDIE